MIICKKCGKENEEEASFCNGCGEQLELNSFLKYSKNKKKKKLSTKIKIFLGIFFLIVIIVFGVCSYTGVFLSHKEKMDDIMWLIYQHEYEEAESYANRYFFFNKELRESAIDEIKHYYEKDNYGSTSITNSNNSDTYVTPVQTAEKLLELEGTNCEEKDNGYATIYTTVKNVGDIDISYVKLNIYFKNDAGEIIGSTWTNDNSNIKPGAAQTIDKFTSIPEGTTNYYVEIDYYR